MCLGLRPDAVRAESRDGFVQMCRVVDTKFTPILANFLFGLRSEARTPDAVAAFQQVCAPGGSDVAELFEQAAGLQGNGTRRYRHFADVFAADRPLAVAFDQSAARRRHCRRLPP